MNTQNEKDYKSKKGLVAYLLTISTGFIVILYLSRIIDQNCTVETISGCEVNSFISSLSDIFIEIFSIFIVVILPVVLIVATAYNLNKLRRNK